MAKLTTKARKALSKSDFALPGKKGSTGKGGYPDDTKGRARNALSRVSEFGSSSEKAKVRAKVHKDWPSIGQEKDPSKRKSRLDSWAKGRREKP
jgi:hypothetical protein